MMLYAKSTGGFYLKSVHGDAIPNDAIEIDDDDYQSLLTGQSSGKRIVGDSKGFPVLVDPPAPTAKEKVLGQIQELEATMTPRRLREAAINKDGGWLADLDSQITKLRSKLE